MKNLPYPKQYSHKEILVKVPKLVNGKYLSHNVNLEGKAIPEPIYKPLTILRCQRECDTHNEFHGWNKSKVTQILKQVGYVK